MATITTTDVLNYWGGKDYGGTITNVVGFADGGTRCVRFKFQSPATGASSVSISGDFAYAGGDTIPPRWYITTSDSSHADACSDAEYHGTISMSIVSGVYKGTGSANVALQPNTTYYLWLFPSSTIYSAWGHYGSFTITTSGSTPYSVKVHHVVENGWSVFESESFTVYLGSTFKPATVTPPAANTTSGSWFKWWTSNYGTVLGTGTTGTDSIAVTRDIVVEVYYPLRTYSLTISQGNKVSITVKRTSSQKQGASTGNLTNGASLYHNDVLQITYETPDGYELETHTVNGVTFPSGGTHSVSGNVSVAATAKALGLIYVHDGTQWIAYQAFIFDGSSWVLHAPHVYDGSSWNLCA